MFVIDESGNRKLSVRYLISYCWYVLTLGYKEEEFNWQTYLKTCKAQAAPKSLFENQNIVSIPKCFFPKEVAFVRVS